MFKTVVLFGVAMLLFACNRKEYLNLDMENKQEFREIVDTPIFVSTEQAIEVANAFFGVQTGIFGLKSNVATRSTASIEAVKDQSNDPIMYIVNYPEGGWAIVSATRNFYPVLAYSDENSFELSSDMGPVEAWIAETKDAIRDSENLNDTTKALIRNMWNEYVTDYKPVQTDSNLKVADPLKDALNQRMTQLVQKYGTSTSMIYTTVEGAHNYLANNEATSLCNFANSLGSPPQYTIFVGIKSYPSEIVGPLLSTKWDQDDPFNYYCPTNLSGNNYSLGCAAVAVSQVMKYHRYPALVTSPSNHRYNWDNMKNTAEEHDNAYSTYSTFSLMKHVADALNTKWGILGFGTSSWAFPDDVEYGIRSYGYSVSRTSHKPVELNSYILSSKKPIIMLGGSVNLPNPLSYIGESHYWVCDGAKYVEYKISYFLEFINPYTYTYYSHPNVYTPSNPFVATQYKYLYFHMNWGWGGSRDGWFTNVNSGNGNFQYGRQDYYISKP